MSHPRLKEVQLSLVEPNECGDYDGSKDSVILFEWIGE
jgi:hypothetical protein